MTSEETTPQAGRRRFVTPLPGEDWAALAARVFPDEDRVDAEARLRSWNLHLFARIPPGRILGSDVLFVEPPRGENARSG